MSVARFIADHRTFYRVPHAFTCRVLTVSEAWFYKWVKAPTTDRGQRRALLDEAVREAFRKSGTSYCTPRVWEDLIDPAAVRGGAQNIAQVIFHTDRGSTYTAGSFTTLCAGLKIRQSMGRAGSCFDNATAEAFSQRFVAGSRCPDMVSSSRCRWTASPRREGA